MLAIDHVMWGIADLDGDARRLEERGLPSVPGGEHPALGTSNRIVPLGDAYVELLAPMPGALTWMVRCEDAAAEAERLGVDVVAMERVRPDGRVLSWRLAGLGGGLAAADPTRPVFIEWDRGVDHPGRDGDGPVGSLAWLEVAGDGAALADWLGGRDVPGLRVVPPGGPALRVAVALPGGGEVVLP